MSTATRPGTYESFEDVKRACHAWLMRRDPHYRRACQAMAAHRPGKKSRNPEAPDKEDSGPLALPLCVFPDDL